jgi:predicted nucleic acid-binding protein
MKKLQVPLDPEELIKAQHNVDLMDSIIAATAIINNYSLVTFNIKDFNKIDDLNIYEHLSNP